MFNCRFKLNIVEFESDDEAIMFGLCGVYVGDSYYHLLYLEHGGEGWIWELLWLRDIAIKILGR